MAAGTFKNNEGNQEQHSRTTRGADLGGWLYDTTQYQITRTTEEDEDKVAAAPSRDQYHNRI
jgi:hypothetical protein